jgi:hypothetical protein
MSLENVESFGRGVEAWNRDDFDAWVDRFDPEVEWFALMEMFRGHAGARYGPRPECLAYRRGGRGVKLAPRKADRGGTRRNQVRLHQEVSHVPQGCGGGAYGRFDHWRSHFRDDGGSRDEEHCDEEQAKRCRPAYTSGYCHWRVPP